MQPIEAKSWLEANGGWVGVGGLVLALVGVGLAIWWRPRQSKRLGWKYQSANQIIRMSESQRGRMPIKVVYGEQNVENPNIIVLRIANAGRREIRVDDFDQPITVQFKDSKLLALDVIGQSSAGMTISFKVDTGHPNRVLLNPMLLNAGEWIDLQFLTDGAIEEPSVTARIVGQTGEPFDVTAASWQGSDFMRRETAALTLAILGIAGIIAVTSPPEKWLAGLIVLGTIYPFTMFTLIMANRSARRTK